VFNLETICKICRGLLDAILSNILLRQITHRNMGFIASNYETIVKLLKILTNNDINEIYKQACPLSLLFLFYKVL
jgi:hypothetical protein